MLKSFKTEINPTKEQIIMINKTIGACRFIYHFYISHNKELYENNIKFMSGRSFSVWLNNKYLPALLLKVELFHIKLEDIIYLF